MSTPIYCNGARIGHVDGDTFHKEIQGSRHMLRTPRAIAFDLSTLRDAAHAGATSARVVDTETGTVYTATMKRIREYGGELNRGFGRQWFLTLNHWSIHGETPHFDARSASQRAKADNPQLNLFGEGTR